MSDKIIINTEQENNALIPDRWIVGSGLSTNSTYIIHTASPLMIIQHELDSDDGVPPSTIYVRGAVDPHLLNQLFNEASELIKIYKARFSDLNINPASFLKIVD